MPAPSNGAARPGVAFLLSQLGAHAAQQFAAALEVVGVTPPVAGILRILAATPELSQQELAVRLGMAPSRLVGLVDDLEDRGWVTRARGTTDRRVNRLVLSEGGHRSLAEIAAVARDHEQRILAGLTADEAAHLRDLLDRVADHQGLTTGVHPGYRSLP